MRNKIGLVLIFLILLMLSPARSSTPAGDDVLFIVFGDSRVAFQGAPIPEAYLRILHEVNLVNPDFVIHTGDLVYGYGDSDEQLKIEYSNIGKLMAGVRPRIYFVPGNHDFQTPLTTKYFYKMTGQKKDYFAFDHKGIRFIILNTDVPGQVGEVAGAQRQWLEEALKESKDVRAVFVFMHRPLFSWLIPDPGKNENRPEPMYNFRSEMARRDLIDLLVKYKVTAVFAGHEHLYYRTDYQGIPFITLGGGGATFSAPPDKGGFFNYMIVEVKGKDVSLKLLEPYHFGVETRTYEKNGKTCGEAVVHNIHGEMEKGVLPLRGIKFTLPKEEYEVKAESIIPPSQMVKVGQAVGTLPKGIPGESLIEEISIKEKVAEFLKPYIYEIAPNPENKEMVDVFVGLDAPGTFSVRLTVSPL